MTSPARRAIAAWLLILALATVPALRVGDVARGGSDAVPGSASVQAVERAVAAGVPAGTFYPLVAVLRSRTLHVTDPVFAETARALTAALLERGGAMAVQSVWTTGDTSLVGRSGRTAILMIRADAATFGEAELATRPLRAAIASVPLPEGFECQLTGQPAVLHDLNQRSSSDLLKAERIGIPLALLVLLIVFRSPMAALLPVALAISATTLGLAALYLLSDYTVVSLFAQNAVTMIGLGVGVDYALLLVAGFRRQLAAGAGSAEAAQRAVREVRGTIICSGAAVAVGFLALCLVRLPFLRALAFGGVVTVLAAVVATLTLLPAVLVLLGAGINWPKRRLHVPTESSFWHRWATQVLRRPLLWSSLALCVVMAFVLPVFRMAGWNMGVSALPADLEARRGHEILQGDFASGWVGPAAILIEAAPRQVAMDDVTGPAIQRLAVRLRENPRVAGVQLATAGTAGLPDRLAMLVVIGRDAPETRQAAALTGELRADSYAELTSAGMSVSVTGTAAMLADFDQEIFSRMWIVVPVVLALTFLVLLWHLKSILMPLKAILLNLLSVLASYGFLVLVFQDGHGAGILGLDPPGGLNAFIVLLLFTILFGLSMDYEVFLLSHIRAEYLRTGSNSRAVALGIARTGGVITSAAAIMVALFLSFGFTQLVATREFGLGLAFAVALDATVLRLMLAPALMTMMGAANWWGPQGRTSAS